MLNIMGLMCNYIIGYYKKPFLINKIIEFLKKKNKKGEHFFQNLDPYLSNIDSDFSVSFRRNTI